MLIQASTGTYKVSKGQLLVGNIHLAHRDPDVFPEPNSFKPFRFYENPVKNCLKDSYIGICQNTLSKYFFSSLINLT